MKRTSLAVSFVALIAASGCTPDSTKPTTTAASGQVASLSVDGNHDGSVDETEYVTAVLAVFDAEDLNHDGTVTQTEVIEVFRARDVNNDGQLSESEAGVLILLDRNGDGVVTREEMSFPLTWTNGGLSPSTSVERNAVRAAAENDFVAIDRDNNRRLSRTESVVNPLIVIRF